MDVDVTQNIVNLVQSPKGTTAFGLYVLGCLLGQIAHAGWLWLKKDIPCVFDRFRGDPRATIVSILTNVGGVIGVAIVIPFGDMPLMAAAVMGALQGISSDSVVNKNAREIWTTAQREAATTGGGNGTPAP